MAPWDRPPLPTQADADAEELYASVGCALSRWEDIEGELSHWFALFIGKMWQHEAYDQYYEQGKTGRQRITTLQKAGEAYFVKQPSQEAEAKFSTVIHATREFANRRHMCTLQKKFTKSITRLSNIFTSCFTSATTICRSHRNRRYCLRALDSAPWPS
jgi:hypothetical protein